MYYLNNIISTIIEMSLYYILKYNEDELMKLANLSNTIQLAKNKLESFQIPILNNDQQLQILKCIEIDNKIKQFQNINNDILNSNIFELF